MLICNVLLEAEWKYISRFWQDGTEKLEAYTYVWENKTDPDLHGEWDFEVSSHLQPRNTS